MSKLNLPPYTCPEIDELIKGINKVERLFPNRGFTDIDEANEALRDIECEISDWESKLESLRKSNVSLREFAEEEHENYEWLKSKLKELTE